MNGENASTESFGWDMGILLVLAGVLGFVHNLSAAGNPLGLFPLVLTALGVGQLMNQEQENVARRGRAPLSSFAGSQGALAEIRGTVQGSDDNFGIEERGR